MDVQAAASTNQKLFTGSPRLIAMPATKNAAATEISAQRPCPRIFFIVRILSDSRSLWSRVGNNVSETAVEEQHRQECLCYLFARRLFSMWGRLLTCGRLLIGPTIFCCSVERGVPIRHR